MTRPLVLVILDGFGHNPDLYGNAIAAARTPALDRLFEQCPHSLLDASGEAVGLPPGQQGNSEVGHLTIGSGRVIFQPLSRINRAIAEGSFFDNPALCQAVDSAKHRGAALHCMGLVSPGGVHSHQDHAVAIAELARRRGLSNVWMHVFTDGRDEPPTSAAAYVATFNDDLRAAGAGRIASVTGRYFAMDRDRRWDRIEAAYTTVIGEAPRVATDAVIYIESQYAAGVTDEFLPPVAIEYPDGRAVMRDGDSVVFFNFRPDRARQLSHALLDQHFDGFPRPRIPQNLSFVSMTEYARDLPALVAFPREDVRNTLAEVVSNHGLRQFHVAETEKYAHVTYFINGGREQPFAAEERLLVPSQRVATYDTAPEMSAEPVTAAVVEHLRRHDDALVVVNYANPDMVGHTGVFDATVHAVELVDRCIDRVATAVIDAGGAMLLTADHGNAEYKIDRRDGSPLTAHTTSPVPLLLCGVDGVRLRDRGGLQDVAPTALDLLELPIPDDMTGHSLLERD